MPHVLSATDMPAAELLRRAEAWRQRLTENATPPIQPKAALVALLFYEPSTRTRAAFEQACVLLGYHPLVITVEASSIVKGESLQDTVRTLNAQGVRAIVIRHPHSGAPQLAAQVSHTPILNAGDGAHEHPTQALLDLYTLWLHYGKPDPTTQWLSGRKMAIVGDIRHSRVARSNLTLLTRAGAEVWLCAPPTLQPDAPLQNAHLTSDASEAVRDADVVMALRLQTERMAQGLLPSLNAYRRDYQLNTPRLQLAKPDCVVMHPGPIQRGVEIADEVADGARSLILTQVQNGVYVRAAVLEYALEEK
ncbi:MAG: aspartate carbamoyltransferase catalytic subunit [Fimbriimonadales bacterium]|nr:aspartate carbamoyltransferase catalytic subunit [Fimbriimonadales bacterium]